MGWTLAIHPEDARHDPVAMSRPRASLGILPVRIIGSKNLLQTLTGAVGVKPAMPGVRSSVERPET